MIQSKVLSQRLTFQKHVTLMSSERKAAVWPRETGPCFEKCQLAVTWMFNLTN